LLLQDNFDSPFLCGAGPFLSALHLWQFLQNSPGITELSDQGREISQSLVQPVFPVPMLLFQLVQVFPCDGVWMKSGTAAHIHTDIAAGPVILLSSFLPIRHSSKLNFRKTRFQVQEVE